MKNISQILIVIFLSQTLFSQDKDLALHNLILGDWFLLGSLSFQQSSIISNKDSAYLEVAFLESEVKIYSWSHLDYGYIPHFEIKNNYLIGYTDSSKTVEQFKAYIQVIDSNNIFLRNNDINWKLHRIVSDEYKLSEFIKDNRTITNRLNIPILMRTELFTTVQFYYLCCLFRREMLIRLSRNEINKETVISFIKESYIDDEYISNFEKRQFERFIIHVNDFY